MNTEPQGLTKCRRLYNVARKKTIEYTIPFTGDPGHSCPGSKSSRPLRGRRCGVHSGTNCITIGLLGKRILSKSKRPSGSPILLKIVSENQFYGKTYFHTIASRFEEENIKRISSILNLRERDPRGSPLDPVGRLCLFLAYVGGNPFQEVAGRLLGVKRNASMEIIHEVADALVTISRQYI